MYGCLCLNNIQQPRPSASFVELKRKTFYVFLHVYIPQTKRPPGISTGVDTDFRVNKASRTWINAYIPQRDAGGKWPKRQLTGVVGVGVFSRVAVRSKAGQTVVRDLQDEAVVDDTVGRLEFPVRDDDAVVEEHHALQREREAQNHRRRNTRT